MSKEVFDAVVVGSGIAGMSAALTARENDADVVVLEKAPEDKRGGSTRFSWGITATCELGEYAQTRYTAEQLYDDIMRVTQGRAEPELVEVMVSRSAEIINWLTNMGVEWEPPLFMRARHAAIRYFKGGAETMMNTLFRVAQERGIEILYNTSAKKLLVNNFGRVVGVKALSENKFIKFLARGGVILASGGFEANVEMRTKYLGSFTDNAIVRGSRYNTGDGRRMAMEVGAKPSGQWFDINTAVIDARSPKIECGVTIVNYPFSIMVDQKGKRFLDEGKDLHDRTFSIYGKELLKRDDKIVFCIFDKKVEDLCRTPQQQLKFTSIEANTIEDLAQKLGIDPKQLVKTVDEFNAAVQPGQFDPFKLDGKYTKGIEPPKSNWAQKIDEPPFFGVPVTGGITFTFGGLEINTKAQVIDTRERVIPGLYAAGNEMGGIYYHSRIGGGANLRATVFGRIAGEQVAAEAKQRTNTLHV